jgi:hypothetical protein
MKLIKLAVVLATFSSTPYAATVDFQGLAHGDCAVYGGSGVTSGGYDFAGNPAAPDFFGCSAGFLAENTSNALLNANSLSIITMTKNGGGAFSLNSFDAGNRTQPTMYGVATGIDVLGYLSGGGTINQQFSFNGDSFDTFTLSVEFANLTSVVFTALGAPFSNPSAATVGPEFLIDNIVVNPSPVPAPPAFILMLTGLGLLGLTKRLRKAV